MHVLTLFAGAPPSPGLRSLLQRIAAVPTPPVPGLRARHWCAGRRSVYGRYLFEERDGLQAFARDPAAGDPAIEWMAAYPEAAPIQIAAIDVITSTDVFDRPIFIISAPRAGSTMLYEMLSRLDSLWTIDGESHGVIEGLPALHLANRGFDSHRLTDADADPETIRTIRAGFVAELCDRDGRRYLELPATRRPPRVRLLEKTPENALRIPFLQAVFPDARFVLLHRDARQNVSSLIEAWGHDGFVNIPDLPGWPRRRWCFLLPPGWRALGSAPLSDVAARQWRAANEHALNDLEAVPRDRWTSVDYVDLVVAAQPVTRRLCAFMDVGLDARQIEMLRRPPAVSSTTVTPPSPIKWRSNRALLESSFNDLGLVAGRLRNLATAPVPRRQSQWLGATVRFACFLNELDSGPIAGRWIVNPGFHLQEGATPPLPVLRRTRFRERFLPDHPLLWVEDAATRVLYPFWARRDQLAILRALQAGREPPTSLSPEMSAQLRAAGVLMTADDLVSRSVADEADIERARDLHRNRYCTLPSLIHPAQIAALARYYRALIDSGQWHLGDDQVERRYGWHNEPIARFFHHQLADTVSRIAGERVKPTYSYSSAYRGGAALPAHMDRKQCDFTMSLLVDRSVGFTTAPWPLWFHAPGGIARVSLGLGDAVLFRGCELPHWREEAPTDEHQVMLLFHYVAATFVGVLD